MWEFKPCKKVNVFKYDDNNIYIASENGVIHLGKAGKIFWIMADGKNTIKSIVDKLCLIYDTNNREEIYNRTIKLMKGLYDKKLLIMNWDPLYKNKLDQGGEV